jgi:hypothetical protein
VLLIGRDHSLMLIAISTDNVKPESMSTKAGKMGHAW